MALFDSFVNGKTFRNKPIISFVNENDKLSDKLAASPTSEHFTDYTGPDTDLEVVTIFFAERFRQLNRTGNVKYMSIAQMPPIQNQ
jgi:hypothetical protein